MDPVFRSCGYGELDSAYWPFFNGASISTSSSLYNDTGAPMTGCGRCIEVQCVGSVRATCTDSKYCERCSASAP